MKRLFNYTTKISIMHTNDLLKEIQKYDSEINTHVTFLAQYSVYSVAELNAIRFFALNILQAKMNKQLRKEGNKTNSYQNSFNTHLQNTKY